MSGDGETPAPTGTTQAEPPAHSDSGAPGTAPDPAPSSAGPSSTLSPEEGSPPDLSSRRSRKHAALRIAGRPGARGVGILLPLRRRQQLRRLDKSGGEPSSGLRVLDGPADEGEGSKAVPDARLSECERGSALVVPVGAGVSPSPLKGRQRVLTGAGWKRHCGREERAAGGQKGANRLNTEERSAAQG
ncbi:hypothetical protein MMC07_008690 [Pseudocyphellaria aurata]|nr:hypothetical protein [Pseudocyphellaria aurata]